MSHDTLLIVASAVLGALYGGMLAYLWRRQLLRLYAMLLIMWLYFRSLRRK